MDFVVIVSKSDMQQSLINICKKFGSWSIVRVHHANADNIQSYVQDEEGSYWNVFVVAVVGAFVVAVVKAFVVAVGGAFVGGVVGAC